MKSLYFTLLISVLAFSSVLGGHIWVEDPVLEFQNAKDVDNNRRGTIWVTFMLQSGLGADDFIKMTFPENLGSVNALIFSAQKVNLNANLLKTALNVDQPYGPPSTQSTQPYYWNFGVALTASTWYKLQLTFHTDNALPTIVSTFFNSPWTIATVSSATDADFIYYDENLSAGLIARAAPPIKTKNANVTWSTTKYDSTLEASNDVYVDIDTTYGYDDGAFVEITMDNNDFSFKTACSNTAVTCSPGQASCFNLTAVTSYACNLQKVFASDSTTRQVLFEHKSPIIKGNGFRVKTTVLNPYYYTTTVGGVHVRLYSRVAKLWYEEQLVINKFAVERITLTDKIVTYFWGLEGRPYNTSTKCPLGIYVSPTSAAPYLSAGAADTGNQNVANTFIVNKVRVYFTVTSQDFPAGRNNQLSVLINAATNTDITYIDSSFSTNLPLVSGKRLVCRSDSTLMTISCDNIGDAKKDTSYWFGVMFVLKAGAYRAAGFGTISFKSDIYGSGVYSTLVQTQNSAGIIPTFLSDAAQDGTKNNFNDYLFTYRIKGTGQGYSQLAATHKLIGDNQIISIPSDQSLTVAGGTNDNVEISTNIFTGTAFSHGIQYDSVNAFKLLLLIEAYPVHVCCTIAEPATLGVTSCAGCKGLKAAVVYVDGSLNNAAANTWFGAHILFKCIFNIDMMSTYSDSTQLQKGVQTTGGFFSGPVETTDRCDILAVWTNAIGCSVMGYDTYSLYPQATQDTAKRYNLIVRQVSYISQGVTLSAFGELSLSCNHQTTQAAPTNNVHYCSRIGAYNINAANANFDKGSPAIVFRNVKLATSFYGNPLYPNINVFDFIICFRFFNSAPNTAGNPTTLTLGSAEGTIATYGILQSSVYNVPQSSTSLKVSMVNWFETNGAVVNSGNVLPTLIRFGGRFNSTDFQSSVDALCLFIDSQSITFAFSEVTTDTNPMSTNGVGCGAMSAAILCTFFKVSGGWGAAFATSVVGVANTDVQNAHNINFLQAIVFKGVYTSTGEFNHFFPVQFTTATTPKVANVGQLKESTTSGQWEILSNIIKLSVYKSVAVGHNNQLIKIWYPYSANGAAVSAFTLAENTNTSEFRASDKCTTAGSVPLNTAMHGFINNDQDLLPAKASSTTGVLVDAGLAGASCNEMTANYESAAHANSAAPANIGWGAAFTVSASYVDPFPDATNFTWPYYQSSGYPANRCLKFSYAVSTLSASIQRNFLITCPLDRWLAADGVTIATIQPAGFNNVTLATDRGDQTGNVQQTFLAINVACGQQLTVINGMQLGIQPFSGPWNWGKFFDAGETLSYGWSQRFGQLLAYQSYSQSNAWNSTGNSVQCSIGAVNAGWNRNGNAQMISFTTTLKQVSIQLNYKANYNVFKIDEQFSGSGMTSNDVIQGYCTVQGTENTCSLGVTSAINTFTVTGTGMSQLGTQTKTVSAGTPFIINYWINSHDTDPTASVYHGALFYGWNQLKGTGITGDYVVINDCFSTNVALAARTEYSGSTTVLSQSITVAVPYYMYQEGKTASYSPTAGARGWFDQSWSVSRTVYKFTQFDVDISWIWTAQSSIKTNMHCVPHSNQKVNFQFTSLSMTSSTIALIPKKGVLTSEKVDYSMANTQFSVRCFGGVAPPTSPTSSQRPTIKWQLASTTIMSGISDDLSSKYTALQPKDTQTTVVLNSKTWNSRGSEATYVFKITPSVAYPIGTRILFEFSRAIAGKFNRGGALECNQDSVPLYCNLVSERLVYVLINQKLDNSSSPNYGHNITLRGIAQPDVLDAYKKIFVGIDLDQDFSNGINFITELQENVVDNTIQLKLLPVLSYTQAITETKVTFTLNVNLKFPKTTVVQDQVLYAQFPGYDFQRPFFHGFTPICTFSKLGDITTTQYFSNCTYVGGRKIKIYLKLDPENALNELVYQLTMSAVPTPFIPTSGGNVVEFSLVDASDVPLYRSNMGYFNSTPQPFAHNNLIRLQWLFSELKVYPGVYNAIGNFTQNDLLRFSKSFTYSFKGINATSFRTYPKILAGTAGYGWAAFYVGAEFNVNPGLFQIIFDKTEDPTIRVQTYAIIEPLDLRVEPFQCTIGGYSSSYDIVAGGVTLPIVFSFANCLPHSDVTLSGNVTDYTLITLAAQSINFKNTSSDFSVDFKFVAVSDPMQTLTTTFIQLTHTNVSAIAATNAAKLHTYLSGTNKDSYSPVQDITINVVPQPSAAPFVSQFVYETYNGGVALTFQCSYPGQLFYALTLDTNNATLNTMQASDIKAQSLQLGYAQTTPDPNDKYFTKYGYIDMPSVSQAYSIKVNNVASLRNYSAVAFCWANSNQVSVQRYINFTQYDNGGRSTIIFGNFSQTVPRANLAKFVCGLASAFHLAKTRVFTQYADICSIFRTRMLQNATTVSVNTGTDQTAIAVHAFSVTCDYLAPNEGTYDELKAATTDIGFVNLVNGNLKPDYLGLAVFQAVQQVRSKTSTKPVIPVLTNTQQSVVVTNTGGSVPFSIQDQAGYIFLVVGDQYAARPTLEQVKLGQTGNATQGVFFDSEFVDVGQTLQISLSGFTQCTKYQWWFVASEADPSALGYFTGVYTGNNFTTLGCLAQDAIRIVTGLTVLLISLFSVFML